MLFLLFQRKGNKVRHFPHPPPLAPASPRTWSEGGTVSHKAYPSPSPHFPQSGKVRKKLTMLFLPLALDRVPTAAKEEG